MRETNEAIAKQISEIVRDTVQKERGVRQEAYDEYIHSLKAGAKMPGKPTNDDEFRRLCPGAWDYILKRRFSARREIDSIINKQVAEIRKQHISPMPDEASRIVNEWKSYTPTREQLTAFMDLYGEYPQAAQIVTKAAKDAGLNFKVVSKASAEIDNLTDAGNMAKALIGTPGMYGDPARMERDTLNRIEGLPTGSVLDMFKAPALTFDETQYAIIDNEAVPVIVPDKNGGDQA